MENLLKTLERHLKTLDIAEIDETAYLELNDGLFSVSTALRYYFGEEPYHAPKQITLIMP